MSDDRTPPSPVPTADLTGAAQLGVPSTAGKLPPVSGTVERMSFVATRPDHCFVHLQGRPVPILLLCEDAEGTDIRLDGQVIEPGALLSAVWEYGADATLYPRADRYMAATAGHFRTPQSHN